MKPQILAQTVRRHSTRLCLSLAALLASAGLAAGSNIRDGLVAYWPLDENTLSTTADAAFTNTMTVVNVPTVSAGQFSNAFTFNGTSIRLTNNHAADNTATGLPIYKAGSYTVAMWVKGAAQTARYLFTEAGANVSGDQPLFLIQTGNTAGNNSKLDVYLRTDSNLVLVNHAISAATVFDNTWHHIAFVDDQGRCKIYVDGNQDATFTYLPQGTFTSFYTTLGALVRGTPPTAPSGYFSGQMDDVAVWERSLSQDEINQVRTNSISKPVLPLVPGLHGLPPADQTRKQGDWASFTMPMYGSRPYVTTFQWSSNGIPIPGATGRTYQTPTGQQTNNSGDYYSVAVSNDFGGFWFVSTNATLTITPDPTPAATNGLVHYWPLDVYDENVHSPELHYGHKMVMRNFDTNTMIVSGQFSNAALFIPASPVANSTYGYRTNGTPIYFNTQYSVSMWVQANGSGQADARVFSEGSTSSTTPLWSLGVDGYGAGSSSLRPYFRTDGNVQSVASFRKSTRPVFDATWRHIVWTDDNGDGKLYVDGVLDETDFAYTRLPITNLNMTAIGATARASIVTPIAGQIDEVATWNRVLTWSEIQEIRTNGVPVPQGVEPPVITTQPPQRTNDVFAGDTVPFATTANGTPPLSYQWLRDGVNVDGGLNPSALTDTLILTNVLLVDSNTAYSLIITNAAGSVTSIVSRMYVQPWTPATNGEVLKVDFGMIAAPNGQPGFTEILGPGPVNIGSIKVTLSGIGAPISARNRTTPVNNPPNLTQAQVYQDFGFANSTADATGMRVSIERLGANTPYGVMVWSFDSTSTGTRVSSWSETASALPVTITNDYTFNGANLPTRDYQYTFGGLVYSSADGKLQLDGIRQPTSVNNAAAPDAGVFVNALRLVAYPNKTTITKTELVGGNLRLTVQGEYPGQPIYIHQRPQLESGSWGGAPVTVLEVLGPIVVFEVPVSDTQMFFRAVSFIP